MAEPAVFTLTRKASESPAAAVLNALLVLGSAPVFMVPTTYARPEESTAMARAVSIVEVTSVGLFSSAHAYRQLPSVPLTLRTHAPVPAGLHCQSVLARD